MPINPNEWYQKAIAPGFRRADEVRYMQMQHQAQQSPYQQFQSEYPAIDQYARDVVSGRRFAKTIHDTGTLMSQALDSPEALSEAVGLFGIGGITKAQKIAALRAEANANRFGKEVDTSYRIAHEAPSKELGSSLDDISNIYPDDIYSGRGAEFYGHYGRNNPLDVESVDIMRRFKNKPNSEVTIYRAVPKGVDDINSGDWITINKNYAIEHGKSWVDDGSYNIIEKKVKAKDLNTVGDSIHEWGYNP